VRLDTRPADCQGNSHAMTLELKINFIRALTTNTGPVRALGKVIHSGKSTAIAEGRIEDPDGKLHALCTTTCLLFPMA
jgi:uncharacterized protein (TIGR00369 family)